MLSETDPLAQDSVKEHKKQKRTYTKNKTCAMCNETFKTLGLLRQHRKIHLSESERSEHTYRFDQEIYTCNTCSAEFQVKEQVEKHMKSHDDTFECTICGEKFEKAYLHAVHMFTHCEDNLYRCTYCKFQTPNRKSLYHHITVGHLRTFYFQCKTCGKGFTSVSACRDHENTHLGLRPYVCVVCSKDFAFSTVLYKHQLDTHRAGIEGKLHSNECSVCHTIYKKRELLEKHFRNRHGKNKSPSEKKHLCDFCGKGYAHADKLKLHYRVHTGDKPFTCSYCAKSFTKKDYLVTHERIHTGEKPYACEYCGKCFNQRAPLKVHLRIHTKEKPYVCQLCGVGFTAKGSLTTHRKSCIN